MGDKPLVLIVLLVVVPGSYHKFVTNCPDYCSCFSWQNLKKAACIRKNIISADITVPKETEALDLSGNIISSLSSGQFHEQGLTSLKYLSLYRNHIKDIDMNAFHGLTELRVLDLSHNHIYYLLPLTFDELPKLKVLNISSNKFREWTLQLSIPSLEILDLSNCQLHRIGPRIFTELPNLSSLYLRNNNLIHLQAEDLFAALNSLKKVTLSGNPWKCDGETNKLESWFITARISVEGLCNVGQTTEVSSDKFQRMLAMSDHVPAPTSEDYLINFWDDDTDVETITSVISSQNCSCMKDEKHILQVAFFDRIPSFWAFVLGFQLCAVICIICIMVWQRTCCKKNFLQRNSRRRTEPPLLPRETLTRDSSCTSMGNGLETPPPAYRSLFHTHS